MLEIYGVRTGVMPAGGGWRYVQPLPEGGEQRIPPKGCAGTDKVLVEKVTHFRISAGIDLGDVASDVALYIKTVAPGSNRYPNRPHKAVERADEQAPGFRPYIERIKDWLIQKSRKESRLVIEDEADERVTKCIGCPHNVPWKTGCLPCCESIVSRGQNVRQRPAYKHDDDVGACRLHDIHISTAIFLDRDELPPTHPKAPDYCWLKTNAQAA